MRGEEIYRNEEGETREVMECIMKTEGEEYFREEGETTWCHEDVWGETGGGDTNPPKYNDVSMKISQ